MRVLHLAEVDGGGVPLAISQYISNTPDLEHHLALPIGVDLSPSLPANVHRFQSTGHLARMREIRLLERHLQPSVVHAHSSWAGLHARLSCVRPVVYQPHAFAFLGRGSRARRLFYRAAERALARRTAMFFVLSEEEGAAARRFASSRRVHSISNVATISDDSWETWGGRADPPVIAMCGRIAPQKDPDFFLQLAAAVREERPDAQFVWIGDGDMEMRRRLECGGVLVTGWLSADVLAETLASASLYVHTARYEGFPLSVLDAAAVGVPIAVRSVASLEEALAPSASSAEMLAELCLRLLEDPAEGREAAVRLHGRYTASRQAESLVSGYARATVQREDR